MTEPKQTIPKNDAFWGFGPSKTIRFITCQTGGMSLWVALNQMIPSVAENRRPTREEYKAAVLSWPYEVASNCICKDCRYFRFVNHKKSTSNV